ncbi:MAG: helicase-related protein [bacterium]|nr:helicase-related protein [bacterium]
MANPNDNIYRLYQNGLKHFSLPDFDTFQQDMKDEQKRKRFYNSMQSAYDLPDFDTFSKDIGMVAPPPSAAPAQPAAQAQPQQQAAGWKPSPVQQQYMQWQMDQANTRLKKMGEDFQQRMDGIKKGNSYGAFMGEREFNPQTGQMETHYYTQQGERVGTRMEQSQRNTAYNEWWETNTEEGKRSREQRLQREYDDRLSHLWSKHDPSTQGGMNAAERAWNTAESAYNAAAEKNRQAADFNTMAFAMNSSDAVAFKQLEQIDNYTDRLTTHDITTLMDNAWANLGEETQNALIEDCFNILRYRYPGADELELHRGAEQLARQQSDLRMYNLAVANNVPRSKLEFFMRKVQDGNLVMSIGKGIAHARTGKDGDVAAYEQAMGTYASDHKVLNIAGMVTGFVADPTTWMSAGVGGAAAKGTLWGLGRYAAGRGVTAAMTNAAVRQVSTTLGGRVVAGVVGGAVNFGTFEAIKEAENQFVHGGEVIAADENDDYRTQIIGYKVGDYSAGAIAKQGGHGMLMGAAIGWLGPVSGNVSDKLVRATASTAGKAAIRTGTFVGSTMAEGTIFSVPEWISDERDAYDVWTDNMAMMVGFKVQHGLKSAPHTIAEFGRTADGRRGMASRIREYLDRPSDGGMALTKDEKAELEEYGYDLNEMVRDAGDPTDAALVEARQEALPSKLTEMVTDPRLSEAVRAKMYYYATGRRLPMSTIMRGELLDDGNGGFIVQSHGANGVITSRGFKNRKAADLELERINRQAELNKVDLGEKYQQTEDFEKRLQDACRKVADENGWNAVDVYRLCSEARRDYKKGVSKEYDEAMQGVLNKVVEALGEYKEGDVTDAMRSRINEQYGVDIDKALAKEAKHRTEAEQAAIEQYIKELIPEKANEVSDVDAEDLTDQKLLGEEGEPIDPRFEGVADDNGFRFSAEDIDTWQNQQPIGRAVMKYQDRPVEVLSGRVVMMEDGTMVDNERSDASIIIRDLATGAIEMVSPEAILSYEEYKMNADAETAQPAAEQEAAAAEAPAEQPKYTSGQIKIRNSDGTETRGVLTGFIDDDGKHEYYVEGDLQHLHYATDNELDLILSDYQPDEQPQPQEAAPVEQQPTEQAPTEPTAEAPATVEAPAEQPITPTPEASTTGEVAMPDGVAAVATVDVAGRGGSTRRFTVGKNAEGENVVLDESGFMWGHDGNGGNMQPHRPGANMPTWSDKQIAALGNVQPINLEPTAVPNTPESVPNSAENTENSVNFAENPAESVPNEGAAAPSVEPQPTQPQPIEAPAENVAEQTPLQRIPRDEKGNPIFEQADSPETAWDALVEYSEGDAGTAKEIADAMAEKKKKDFEKAQKLKLKGNSPAEMLASKKANAAELAKAQAEYEHWQKMAGVEQSRQAAIRSQQEAEARRLAAERAEAEKAEREAREEAARLEREALEGIPEWHMDTPENARKRGVRRFSGQMFTRQEPLQGVPGKEVEVKFSQKDLPKGRVAVIEASQLQPSHVQGQRNPMFFIDEAQPKNRAEAVSAFAAQEMAEGIRPQEITGSTTAYTGAPTVNARGEVIQGNNRSDALRYLWANNLPEQQAAYTQYLLDNAEQFGIDPEAVKGMQQPVLVNMLDVDDAEAIRLGQLTAQDTESGGIERIKPKNVAQKLGDNMRSFANMLLRSGDDEATFGQLVDKNGGSVLEWMAQKGAITNTQYQSAFDSKGNLTAEAKNDLQKVLYQAVFRGGSQQLEEMFDALPAKAQRAILSTSFRDMDSPFAGKMLPEIQASIAAYHQLMSEPTFAAAKKMEAVLWAVEDFKLSFQLDDRFEQYMPADNFSNFALHLAAMYKANDMSQSTLASYFNQMYDLAQGKKAATLFEEADTTEYPLADVIKKVLNIDYKPAKNGNNNVSNGGADVALRNQDGQGGELRGNEPPASGEQNPAGTEPSKRGAGASDDSRGVGTDKRGGESEAEAPQTKLSKEDATDIIAKMEMSAVNDPQISLSPESWQNSFGLSNSIDTPLGKVKMGEGQYQKFVDKKRSAEFGMVVQTLQDPDVVFIEPSEAKEGQATERDFSYVFVKTFIRNGQKFKYYTSVSVLKDGMEVSVSSHIASKTAIMKKLQGMERAYTKQSLLPNSSEWHLAEHPTDVPDLLPTQGKSDANLETSEKTVSDRKVNNSASEKQVSGQESSVQPSDSKGEQTVQTAVEAASAQVNTTPTPAQAEAGNYKKGHVTIGEFDITIENPAGSVRKGVDADGKEWSNTMANTYGYIKGTEGVDGDHIDVFLHSDMDQWNGRKVFVVDQTNPDGSFDEHKVMLGFNDKDEAMAAYLANYDDTWAQTHPGLRISEANIEDFNKWVDSSHRKTKPFADYSTVSKVVDEAPVKTEANIGEGYKIESNPYTNKQGKTLDTYLVTFDRDFSKEELSALRAKAKALKGWYDRESKGWMLRSSENAKAFAEEVTAKSEDEVADEAPLSMADMEKPAAKPKKAEAPAKPTESPMKQVDVEGVFDALKTKGETKLNEHATPAQEAPKPKKRRWISDEDADEFDSLRKDLRNHFGKDGDIVQEAGADYGKPKPKQMDAEVLRMGTRMTYLMMKGGLRSFSDYCEAMKDELPDIFDDMRPHLKSLYAAAQNMEEVIELGWDEEMDDRKTVKAFDVYNFDKPGAKDIIATAQHAVDENASQQQTDQIIQTLKDQRNEQRKKEADETSADTETIIDKAETTASQVESKLEAANSEEDAEGLSRSLDKELEEVNKQLALLGYYEADPVDKDFNEAYGYMRNAERKAVQDAHRLATQLAADLGITIDPKDKVRKAKYGFGSKIARSNVAPAGGEVYITLPLAEGRELSIWLSLDKNEPWREGGREDRYDEDLMLTGIMYRIENTGKGGMDRYESSNHNTRPTIPYDELLADIRRLVRTYLPDEPVRPAEALTPQPGEDMVQVAARVAKDSESKQPTVKPEQTMGDLFGGLFDMENEAPATQPTTTKQPTKPKANEKTDVQPRSEEAGRGRQQPRPNEPLGESAGHEAERTDGGGMAERGGVHTVPDTKRSAGVSGQHQSERSVAQPKNTRNNHAERGVDYAPKGEKARIDANLAAVELAKKLLASGATATPQEMAILRRYSGWGGLGAAFKEGDRWAPNPINKRLREMLTPEEYEAAVMSRNSAYYTPAPVIDAMWDIAKALGFKGGNIVEGSAGIGNIIGLMPTDISERSNIHAVEIDNTTGGILSLLYPDAKVEVQGFEQTRIPNGSVDLAITNVPFVTGLHVMDETGDSDLSKKFRDIHDFCIAKNVRKLREGGIGIFITSSGTLDKSQKLRNWLVGDKEGCADVVGVFRMNNQTFGGTAATSDIIVVRKRVNGRRSANAIDVSTVSAARTAAYTDDKGKTKDLPILINRYFIEHPEYMGGEMFFGFEQGDTYRPTSMGLFPTRTADQAGRMAAWVQHLSDMDWSKEQGTAVAEQTSHINEALGEGVKEGSMVTDSEGNLCVARMGRAVPLSINKNKIKGRTKQECFKDYTEIKNALAEVLKYQTEHEDDAGLQPLIDRLNKAYDTFVARYGNLNKNSNLAWLRNDVDFSSIVALETYSEKGDKDGKKIKTYGKTDIFSRRVVDKETEPAPKNVKDGIIASLYKFGRIDPEYLATQLGKSKAEVKQEIIESGLGFEDPNTGQMEVSYEYLSGNVREKLREAREANEATGGTYAANVRALEAVLPLNIPAHLIEFTLGSSWVDPKLYERFIKERTELDVHLTNAGGTWHMSEPYFTDKPKNKEMGIRSETLNVFIPGHKLIEAAITNKTITVSKTFKDYDGSSHTETDPLATAACAAKVDEIRQDFKDWAREQMQNDPDLSMRMEQIYNEQFNNSVPKSIPDEFVPEHFGGAATVVGGRPFRLRPHQAKAVIRATTQPVLLAHEVGTGKTYTLITTAMEMRRLGTARKPMIVVQNATVGQFVASAKALYPNAKILTLEDADRNAEGRRAFYAKIKFNDWDMIVVPQSVLERIPDSVERQTQFIQEKIEEKLLVLEQMKDADPSGKSMIVRAAEREINNLENEIAQLASGGVSDKKKEKDAKKAAVTRQNAEVKAREMLDRETDDVEDFDSMGIDAILIDEAHEYKHLGFATAMQRGVKGVDPTPSKKSQGVFLKVQSVLEKTGGKNVVFATGTPISNTAAEIWTFMRYLIPADVMKEYDIFYFDDFVRNFGNIQQMLEFKTNGKYKENNRFAGYVNLPELVRIWSTVADTVLTREAGGVSDKIPAMEGGKAQDKFLPQTRALRSIMKYVKQQLDEYDKMSGKEKKENSHIPLVMYGIAKAAAVDARLVQRDAADDPDSKTNEAVRQTLRSLEETKDYKGTVAIFADNYQNKASGFNLYEDIRKKLIAAGVPEEQVVVMKKGMTVKKKLEIFDRVNAGEVRVVMGSTFTLGTGVNIQERLHTLIHLDAPNRPMDYTQRNGRILRQGNLHKEWGKPVRVLRFGVEDSLDVTAYQRLKTKGAIADSIMNGKQLMENSMDSRSLEEEQDLFGDITAQLSGSEYALLKNQIEKEVRKLTAKLKAWEADQTYIHNRKRQIAGQNKDAEKRIADNKGYLEKVEAATIGNITVGKRTFPSMEAMEDFFTEQNKKKAELQEQVRNGGYTTRATTTDIVINIGGFDFHVHTEINYETKRGQQGDLFAAAPAKMTYSCAELGIENMPVKENRIKNAVAEILEDVVSGEDFRGRIEAAQRSIECNNAELESMAKRDGVPFQFSDELAKAEEKLAEYEELMKKEMEAKEAKYADMDKDVEAAADIELTEEDSEDDVASEPAAEYSAENANFVSNYETKDGKTVRYTSENPEAYGGLFDFDFSNEVPGAEDATDKGRVNRRQQSNPPLQRRNAALLDTNATARLNEANGEYCALERKFRESNYMEFTSAEKVESADDVAFIFEELENSSVENVFVVMTKRGIPTVMHISIGGFNWSAMNAAPVKLAYDRIKPDKVYFVHNHPSGALNCSPQDVNCLKQIEGAIGKKAEGVIMDLKSGKYGTFDSSGTGSSASHDKAPAPAAQRRLRLYAFDRHVFNPDYQPSENMVNAQDVAKFLSSHRLGDRSKVSVLVCNNQNQIVANVHTTHTSIDSKGLAEDIIRAIGEFGGMRAFLYGDFEQSGMVAYRNLTQAVKERSGGVYNLLDVVRIEGNHTWSAREEGYVYEPGSEYGASPEGDIRFREVEDDAVLKEFAEGKTVKAYRTMQVIDGKLYSPMATKVGGKATPEIKLGVPEQAEEHPEIIKRTKVGRDGVEVGYVVIDKGLGKGTLEVAYNPSIHASLTPLNDQFTSADIRPNLVIVETLIPKSELTSGYRAPMAKDAVGEMSWHSGTVSGKLAELGKPRRVILSRYDMPVRIVPFKEVAKMIAAQLEGTDIAIPYNVVTPQVRMELSRLGIAISDSPSGSVGESRDFGKAEYITDREIERINAHQQEMAQTSQEAKSSHAEKLAKKFNTPIQVVADLKELTSDNAERQARMRRSKGFYDPATGKVVVVLPNNVSVEDVAETVFHEVVGHKGLRELIGEENYDAFCDEVYDHLKDELKEKIDQETTRRFMNDPAKGHDYHRRVAVDEMFGRLSEKGFEDFTKAERGLWKKLKKKILEVINKFLGSLKLPEWVKLGDNELRYILWRSHERLRSKGDYIDMARDAVKREELHLNETDALRRKSPKRERIEKLRRSQPIAISGNEISRGETLKEFKKNALEYGKKLQGTYVNKDTGSSIQLQRGRRNGGVNELLQHDLNEDNNAQLQSVAALPKIIEEGIYIDSEPNRDTDKNPNVAEYQHYVCGLKINGEDYTVHSIVAVDNKGDRYYDHKLSHIEKGRLLDFIEAKQPAEQILATTPGTEPTIRSGRKVKELIKLLQINDAEIDFRFRDGETGDIWNDQSIGFEERITNAAIRLSNNQSGDLTLRNDAMRAIGGNLTSLRRAMAAQKRYDQATVKRVADLARILMQNGYLSDMTSGEMQRLISAVKNAVGHTAVKESVQKIMDIMVNNQLRNGEATLRKLLTIRGSKVDARGVEVQGALDVEGQRTMEVVKKAMSLSEEDINDRIAEALNRMSDPYNTIADQAAIEYAGLNMALDYVQNIANSKAEEKALRDGLKTAKEDKDAGRMTADAYKQFVEATEDAIRKNKIERAEAYNALVGRLSDSMRQSIENAKAWREAEKRRIQEIQHNANSDMQGMPSEMHRGKDTWKDGAANLVAATAFAPLATFEQMIRGIAGQKAADGEGYLYNRFVRGLNDARAKEISGYRGKQKKLDEKAKEIFSGSKHKVKSWGDVIRLERKLPKMRVTYFDKSANEMKDAELMQGNLLYIYMVDKMSDGRMKLRKMGITEDDVQAIADFLDPRIKALGDWLQEEFLVETRNEYNETHKRMFGTSMAAIENYFPLKILGDARGIKEDIDAQDTIYGATSTVTGAIKKRKVNTLALDILGADAFNVMLDHLAEMEHWNAYAEIGRDMNALLSYGKFRNRVKNMRTIYGAGDQLWKRFKDVSRIAFGTYHQEVNDFDEGFLKIARGVTAAKVAFRLNTALKQTLSLPAMIPDMSISGLIEGLKNPRNPFTWCMENLPVFEERWRSRISGDPRLMKSERGWNDWRNNVVEIAGRWGMTPNAFIDAVICSIVAKTIYDTKLSQYIKDGYEQTEAEARAKQDASIGYNLSQQSSEGAYLAPIQAKKNWLSVMFTVFRNSPMSYTRQVFDSVRNLKRNLTPGKHAEQIEYMTKQTLREWQINPDNATDQERTKAKERANRRYSRSLMRDALRLLTYGFVLPGLWSLGGYWLYMLLDNDEEEKQQMKDDIYARLSTAPFEGLTGGDVLSNVASGYLNGTWNENTMTKDMPLSADITQIAKKLFKEDKTADGINDIFNLCIQSGFGFNPATIENAVLGILDACGNDVQLANEATIVAARILNCPESQVKKLYFDEIGMSGEEASKLSPAEIAERYARMQIKLGRPIMPWLWNDEAAIDKRMNGRYGTLTTAKERFERQGDGEIKEAYAGYKERHDAIDEKVKAAKKLMQTDYVAAAQMMAEVQSDSDFTLYQQFHTLDKQLTTLAGMWIKSKSGAEAAVIATAVNDYRTAMVKVLGATSFAEQQAAMQELQGVMQRFNTDYTTYKPQPKQLNR